MRTWICVLWLLGAGCSARRLAGGGGAGGAARDLSPPAADLAAPPVVLTDGGSCHPAGTSVPEEWTNWYCCDHAEVNGVCCQAAAGACSDGAPCCSGSCAGGVCSCSAAGAICGVDSDCCGDGLCEGVNQGPNGTCCGRPQAACSSDRDCCGGCSNGRCGPLPFEGVCRNDGDCSSGSCGSDGRCAQNGIGGRCASAGDCSWGGCKNGVCSCTPVGGGNNPDAPCCSGYFAAPACACAAGATPGPCISDGDCCGGHCQRSGAAVGQCACHGPTSGCGAGSECCSGNCSNGQCA